MTSHGRMGDEIEVNSSYDFLTREVERLRDAIEGQNGLIARVAKLEAHKEERDRASSRTVILIAALVGASVSSVLLVVFQIIVK